MIEETQNKEAVPVTLPSPGSQLAIEQGCKCPVVDNGRGRGYMGMPGIFVFNESCPLHFPDSKSYKSE